MTAQTALDIFRNSVFTENSHMMIQCPYCGNIEENRGICSACGEIMIKESEQEKERSGKHSCPMCDNGMLVLKHNSKTRFPFYGCSNYPHCRYTESIDNKQPTKSCKSRNVVVKKESVAGDLEKREIIDICEKNEIPIDHKFTKAKLNASAPRYWANPNKKFLKQTWWLVLVNTDERKLHIFKIPENSIPAEQMKYKTKDLIDLQIYSDRDGFIDSRSGIYFLKWLVKTVSY
ncbi:MAG: topoisomerase DNA-binding C4 zinc finger domain-containing protein [Treponemataceae bacterium]|nr:topoisomerase DNA-binding C4 zinc finger domain-containing protein [Treponemataceae bacterium]